MRLPALGLINLTRSLAHRLSRGAVAASTLVAAIGLACVLFGGGLFGTQSPLGCDASNYDVGIVRTGERLQHQFLITNTSGTVIDSIDSVPDCVCTHAVVSASRLPPGDSALVAVSVSLQGRPGRFQHKVDLVPRPQGIPLSLAVTGHAEACFDVVPNRPEWQSGAGPATFDVSVRETHVPVFVKRALGKDLETAIEEVTPGQHYRVTFAPSQAPKTSTTATVLLQPVDSRECTLGIQVLLNPQPETPPNTARVTLNQTEGEQG